MRKIQKYPSLMQKREREIKLHTKTAVQTVTWIVISFALMKIYTVINIMSFYMTFCNFGTGTMSCWWRETMTY